jgi:hypothetical protein
MPKMKTTRTWTRRVVRQKSDSGYEDIEIIVIKNRKGLTVATLTVVPGSMPDADVLDFLKIENPTRR